MKQFKCSMSKKKESLATRKESANSDYYFHLWSARYPETEKGPTRFIYVDTPSSSSGWYDVSKEYVDSYEEEMNRRNGNINYQYVAKKVMDMIVSGAIKPCKDPFDTIPNFSRWFKNYPFFISASQQDILDGKYATRSESKKSEDMLSRRDAMEKAKQIVSSLKPSASACKSVGLSLAQVKKAFADFNKAYNSKSYVGMSTYDFGDLLSNVANYAYVGGDNSGAMEIMDLAKSALSESKQSKGCSMKRKIESLGKKKSASKKSEAISASSIRVDPYDIAVKVQEVNTYTSTSGASLTAEVPAVEAWFSTLSEFSDCINGLAENCNGYPDISRDGSDILVQINAPKEDESDDYEVIVELRCSTEITSTSLEGVVDILNHD